MKTQLNRLAVLVFSLVLYSLPTSAKDATNVPAEAKQPLATTQTPSPSPQRPVDLNRASKAELKRLPGIGEREANLIISARPFRTKAELVTRNLIPEALYPKLRKLVVAKNPPMPKLPDPNPSK